MRATLAILGLPALVALVASACATATGEVSGGEALFDAAPSSGAADDASSDAPAPAFDSSVPYTWTELYNGYFGSMGVASCSGTVGACHGESTAAGYSGSQFLCPPGDASGCYMGITSASVIPRLIDPGDGKPFDVTPLYIQLRKTEGTASGDPMPKSSTFTFSVTDIAKISTWVAAGATNN